MSPRQTPDVVTAPTNDHATDRDGHRASERRFEEAFLAHAEELRRYAFRLVRSRETAAEIVQDVFCTVWRSTTVTEVGDGLRAYLFRATRNRALDTLASEEVRRRWLEDALRERDGDDLDLAAAPDEVAHEAELAAAVRQTLERMPERRRQVCTLRWRDGLPPREIASRLAVALKTVETQITRGLRDLREALRLHLADG